MADRYWRGANLGAWTTATTNWSSNLAGTLGAAVPLAADMVYLNASSVTSNRFVYMGTTLREADGIIANQYSANGFTVVAGTSSSATSVIAFRIGTNGIKLQAGAGQVVIGNDAASRQINIQARSTASVFPITNESSSPLLLPNDISYVGTGTPTYGLSVTGTGNIVFGGTFSGGEAGVTNVSGNTNGGAVVVSTGRLTNIVSLSSGWIQVGNSSALGTSYTNGSFCNITGGKISSSSGSAWNLNRQFTFSGSVTLGDTTKNGTLTFTGGNPGVGRYATLAFSAPTTLTIQSSVTVDAPLSGSASLTKAGSGSLSLLGSSNTYSGAFTHSQGVLYLANFNSGTPNQLNNASSITLNAETQILGNVANTFASSIGGTGIVWVRNTSASGITFNGTFSGTSPFTGSFRIYSAPVDGGAAKTVTFSNFPTNAWSFLYYNDFSSTVTQTYKYTGSANVTTNAEVSSYTPVQPVVSIWHHAPSVSAATLTVNGPIISSVAGAHSFEIKNDATGLLWFTGGGNQVGVGAMSLTKSGTGPTALSGSFNYTGTVSASAGTLNANSATALGAASSTAGISVSSGATLSLGAALNYSSPGRTTTISGTGVSGVDAGCLVLADAGPLNLGAINATNNTYIRGTTNTSLTSAIAWSGSGGLRLGAATGTTATFSGAISVSSGTLTAILFGRFNNPDLGTVVLTGSNTFTAPAQIDYGTLQISADANLGTAPVAATAAYLIVGGSTTLATTATFTLNANRGIALGPSTGSGTGTINVASATTLTYAGIIANNSTGTGSLVKLGSGTMTLSGANTFSGSVSISAGTLTASNVTALGAGAVTLGASGTLQTLTGGGQNGKVTITGSLTNSAGGIIKIGG